MLRLKMGFWLACGSAVFLPFAYAGDLDTDQGLHDWQLRRLMQPTQHELRNEGLGRVYVYDGLTDREVERALNEHFGRIEFMMFMGTTKTDERGQVLKDAETGKPLQESNGCSN